MTYNETLDYIFSLKTVSLNPSLERISAALRLLSNPLDSLKAIHIAGTNGKGSVASMIAEILKLSGKKTGLFISPYIVEFCERIQINGEYIPKTDLCILAEKVIPVQQKLKEQGLELGQFEFITAVALLYFKEQNCDYVVLETGLGGRFDATNVFEDPICTVITKISFDHTAILGNSLEQIAGEKAGIIKKGVPCVTCVQSPKAGSVIETTCQKLDAPLFVVDADQVQKVDVGVTATTFFYKNENYEVSLLGVHQVENALLAIEAVKIVIPEISQPTIKSALSNVVHPARLEVVSQNPPIIIDGAHNPDGALALSRWMDMVNFKGNIIFGGMKDKKLCEVARMLGSKALSIITVAVEDNPRSESAQNLKELFLQFNNNVIAADSYTKALKLCEGTPTIICGSLYLAADMRRYIGKTN